MLPVEHKARHNVKHSQGAGKGGHVVGQKLDHGGKPYGHRGRPGHVVCYIHALIHLGWITDEEEVEPATVRALDLILIGKWNNG